MKIRLFYKFFVTFILFLNISCGENSIERHFESHQNEIHELITYFNEIAPKDKKIEIEFSNNSKLQRFQITEIDSIWVSKDSSYLCTYPLYFEWEIRIINIPDSILTKINWNSNTFKELKKKLDKAGCVSINNENPIEIGYRRGFYLGMSTFFIFNNYDSIELNNIRNFRTDVHFINDSIAWNFETGAL